MRIDDNGNPVNEYANASYDTQRPRVIDMIKAVVVISAFAASPLLLFLFIFYTIRLGMWIVGV